MQDINTKPYLQNEENPQMANEPAVAYERTAQMNYQGDVSCDDGPGDTFINADFRELGDGFRPFTWDEARQWITQAEENIETGRVVPSERLHSELERKYPWLCE